MKVKLGYKNKREVISKIKRFRFNEIFDLVILKCISVSNAHVAGYAESNQIEFRSWDFMDSHKFTVKYNAIKIIAPMARLLSDRFKLLEKVEHRSLLNMSQVESWFIKVHGDKKKLINKLKEEIEQN